MSIEAMAFFMTGPDQQEVQAAVKGLPPELTANQLWEVLLEERRQHQLGVDDEIAELELDLKAVQEELDEQESRAQDLESAADTAANDLEQALDEYTRAADLRVAVEHIVHTLRRAV